MVDLLFLQTAGFGGATFGDLLRQWEAAGVFTYVLPFLLIFAIVFTILSNVKIFKTNNAVNAIISLAVALMSLQFNAVGIFFSEIFPRLGLALSVILILIILLGAFFNVRENKSLKTFFVIVSFILIGLVIFSSLEAFNFAGASNFGNWLRFNGGNLFLVAIAVGIFIWLITGSGKGRGNSQRGPFPNGSGPRPY